jgi:HPt (histidine-containing phosphotransfer) domain-containing protein
MSEEKLNSAIQIIRGRFLARLTEQYARSRELAQDWQQNECGGDELKELCAIAHKVAGLAKTVGFADLGDTAYQTDSVIQKYLGDSSERASQADVAAAIGTFLASCSQALKSNAAPEA